MSVKLRLECDNCDYQTVIKEWNKVKIVALGKCPDCADSSKAIIKPNIN